MAESFKGKNISSILAAGNTDLHTPTLRINIFQLPSGMLFVFRHFRQKGGKIMSLSVSSTFLHKKIIAMISGWL